MYTDYPLTLFTEETLLDGLKEHPNSMDNMTTLKAIANSYQIMKAEQKAIKTCYEPGGEWRKYIGQRSFLYEALLQKEPERAFEVMKNFWRNELSPIVKQYAMYDELRSDYVTRKNFIEKMNLDLVVWNELSSNKRPESLAVPNVGNHWGLVYGETLVAPKTFRYHLLSEQIKNLIIDDKKPIVVEIGAGYGGMAYFLSNTISCTYIDFDLPESLVIAAYYHLCASPQKRIFLYQGEDSLPSIEKLYSEYDLVFLPNWKIELLKKNSISVVVNTFSFSEMPYSTLENYLKIIEKSCAKYFLHNNMNRSGVLQHGFERIPASHYPVSLEKFMLIYNKFDSFQTKKIGRDGDYREYLYKKRL